MSNASSLNIALREAYRDPYKTQSNFAREFAQEVGALASMGLITTAEAPGQFGKKWRITGIGLEHLKKGGLL